VYTLLVTKGPDSGLHYPIRESRVSVGRASDMQLVLTDPTVRPRHFMVVFEQGGWKAVTYDPDATILVDRRWEHPKTRQRGARIFVGDTQLLLFAGEIDARTAKVAAEGLDIDEETLRDDALTTVGNEAYEFRHDMKGKAVRVSDSNKRPSRGPKPRVEPSDPPSSDRGGSARLPQGVLHSQGSQMAGMMRLPATIDQGRQAPRPEQVEAPKSARSSWNPSSSQPGALVRQDQNRGLSKGLQIKLTDTAISAMPSSSRDLWVLYEKDGPFAAELRILATRLEELKNTFGYKSFLFTSVNEGEGKTVTAANLALVMSEDPERKIALVDANFRSPRAADLFALDKSRGLLSAITGQRSLSECVARVIGRNLIVLHAGGEHKNPAQVLSDPKFKTLLSELSQAIDFMIIDAPCAIPYADVPLLAQHSDSVFMVVGANSTRRADLDKALDTIGRNRVVGTVFRQQIK
jgi:capsular exopolysaccharide synthesis family protein